MAFRSLDPPLTAEQLQPLGASDTRVQFSKALSDAEYRAVGQLLANRPDVALRVFGGYDGSIRDLEFLRWFPGLRRFQADALWGSLRSIDGLRHLPPDLDELGLGATKARLDLSILARFRSLRTLYLEGPVRDPSVLADLTTLEDLTLRSVTLPDLSLLVPMTGLRSLDVKLGGTNNLELLPRIGRLEYVELWLVRGLSDVRTVAQIETLRHLFLQALRQVSMLPSFASSLALRRVDLETMKGLTNLGPLAEAPGLEILNLVDFRHAQPSILRPFIDHPTLRAGIWGFGSNRKNFAAQDLVPVPPEPWGYADARRGKPSVPEPLPWDRPDWKWFRSARG